MNSLKKPIISKLGKMSRRLFGGSGSVRYQKLSKSDDGFVDMQVKKHYLHYHHNISKTNHVFKQLTDFTVCNWLKCLTFWLMSQECKLIGINLVKAHYYNRFTAFVVMYIHLEEHATLITYICFIEDSFHVYFTS